MKISCHMREFNQKWDTKLNRLLDEGTVVCIKSSTLDIALKSRVVVKPYLYFFRREVQEVTIYSVWLSNKSSHYGELHMIDEESIPVHLQYSPSQETLEKLLALENILRNPLAIKAYS